MEKKKIALIGAGAVGCYFIWGLMQMPDAVEFSVIATGERNARLKADGVRINGSAYRPEIRTPQEAGAQDLVVVATKYSGLDDAIGLLSPMIGAQTLVLSMLNGVDSEERIAAVIGWEHVDYSNIWIASRRLDTGVWFEPERCNGIFIGNEKIAQDLLQVLMDSPLYFIIRENILLDLWTKYACNIINNLPQAVIGVGADLYLSEHGYFLAEQLWYEVEAVASAKGVELGHEPKLFHGVHGTARYSTLQDLDAGRHTEIDMFCGQMIRMGETLGIPVPYCTYTYHAIKALEEKNDGRFDKDDII